MTGLQAIYWFWLALHYLLRFLFGFTIKRFLFMRRVRLHVKGKKRLVSTTSSRANYFG